MNKKEKSISELISYFVSTQTIEKIPKNVLEFAKLCITDAVGIAYASRKYDFSRSVLKTMTQLSGNGDSLVIGQKEGLSVRDAAFCNAALIHGLDFDDTHLDSVTHCSSSLLPVALNLGLETNSSGKKVLLAYILGMEIISRIGIVAGGQLQKLGYHPTGIIGAFGCAVTASHLYNLNPIQIEYAIGIVSSMAAGNMEFVSEGAWNKRIHPAWAAVSGITAASLAKNNFIGPKHPLEGTYGLYTMILGENKKSEIYNEISTLGSIWQTLGNAIKPYPACHFNHAFADCALSMKKKYSLKFDSIKKITALVHKDQVSVVCEPISQKRRPANSYEAQFSIPYIVSAILVHDRFTLTELTTSALENLKVLDLAAKVHYATTDRSLYPKYFSGILVIETNDNKKFEMEMLHNRGSSENPLSESDVKEKFSVNCSTAIGTESSANILKSLDELQKMTNLSRLRDALRADA